MNSQLVVDLNSKMNNSYAGNPGEATAMGYEILKTSDSGYNSGYNNVYTLNEDEAHDPPEAPPQLQHTLVGYPANVDTSDSLPLPQAANLNHLYIENREPQRSVVALGFTHRFLAKYVTVVLYKPVQRSGTTATKI